MSKVLVAPEFGLRHKLSHVARPTNLGETVHKAVVLSKGRGIDLPQPLFWVSSVDARAAGLHPGNAPQLALGSFEVVNPAPRSNSFRPAPWLYISP